MDKETEEKNKMPVEQREQAETTIENEGSEAHARKTEADRASSEGFLEAVSEKGAFVVEPWLSRVIEIQRKAKAEDEAQKQQRREPKGSHNAYAQLGRNQQLVLQLLRRFGSTRESLRERFIKARLPAHPDPDQEKRAGATFKKVLQQLQNRYLVQVSVQTSTDGERKRVVDLTPVGRGVIYERKNRQSLEEAVVEIINLRATVGYHRKKITSTEVLRELAKRGITGPSVNTGHVGRILGRYLPKKHGKHGTVYLLKPVVLRQKFKRTCRY
jgi:hypothetical protein